MFLRDELRIETAIGVQLVPTNKKQIFTMLAAVEPYFVAVPPWAAASLNSADSLPIIVDTCARTSTPSHRTRAA